MLLESIDKSRVNIKFPVTNRGYVGPSPHPTHCTHHTVMGTGDGDVCLSVCRQSYRVRLYGNYQTNQREDVATINVDYRIQYYDNITNVRWRVAANMKIVISAYLSEKNIRLRCNLAHCARQWPKLKMAGKRQKGNIVFACRLSDFTKFYTKTQNLRVMTVASQKFQTLKIKAVDDRQFESRFIVMLQ